MRHRLLRDGYVVLLLVLVGLRLFGVQPWNESVDAFAYWTTRDGSFYDGSVTGRIGAYLYSPAFAQLVAPLVVLPFAWFCALWTLINGAALWFVVRRGALLTLLFLPATFELISGNVHLLLATAIVLGFRFPAAWAFAVLTKVTPGVGVLWFAARREWRSLAIACLATLAIAAVSWTLDPSAWGQWFELLRADAGMTSSGDAQTTGWYLPVPLGPRLIVAACLIVLAARTNRQWVVPFGVVLAMPVVWVNSLAVLTACVPLALPRLMDTGIPSFTASRPRLAATSPVEIV